LITRAPRTRWHNGRVSNRFLPARAAGVAVLAALTMVLAGCGGSGSSDKPSASPATPTPSVAVPDGVTLTTPGDKLDFGDTADVAYQPNANRSTVLSLKVTKVLKASLKDFSAYVLDARTKKSTPYYVFVDVANLGTGDVGGTDVPLWAVNQDNVLIHSSTFTNTFKACPSPALPKHFAQGAKLSTCLVYLIPDHGSLESVSFRPLQAVAGIEWSGTVSTTRADARAAKKAAQKAAQRAKKNKKKKAGS